MVNYQLILILLAVLFLIKWIKQKYSFWKSQSLITPPYHYIFGNFRDVVFQKETLPDKLRETYDFFKKRNVPHGGVYSFFTPHYVPVDLAIIKTILRTNFENFTDRGVFSNEKDDPLSANLFTLDGARWKSLRRKFTPTFTAARMKMMFEIVMKCTDGLTPILDELEGQPVNIKNILARYATDVIGNCAFGIECNCLKNPDNGFQKNLGAFFNRTFVESAKLLLADNIPEIMKLLRTRVNRLEVSNFVFGLVKGVIDFREKNNIVSRKDFMHSMIQLKNRGRLFDDFELFGEEEVDEKYKVTIEEIGAQALVFLLGGHDTTSTTMSFVAYILATHQDIQRELRDEILSIIEETGGKLTYDLLSQMVILDKVLNETLRLYPPVPYLIRACSKDFRIPDTDLILRKGQRIFIPTFGLHYDADFFPEPQKFDPERFSAENIGKIDPSSYLPFGDGPRNCIARRFAYLQTKIGLIELLRNYELFVHEKTREPLEFDTKNSLVLSVKDGIWLTLKKIT